MSDGTKQDQTDVSEFFPGLSLKAQAFLDGLVSAWLDTPQGVALQAQMEANADVAKIAIFELLNGRMMRVFQTPAGPVTDETRYGLMLTDIGKAWFCSKRPEGPLS